MEDREDVCRICLGPNALVSLLCYDDAANENTQNKSLSQKIFFCTAVHTSSDDMLPKSICGDCHLKVEAAHCLREMAQESDNTLRERCGMLRIEYNNVWRWSEEVVHQELGDDIKEDTLESEGNSVNDSFYISVDTYAIKEEPKDVKLCILPKNSKNKKIKKDPKAKKMQNAKSKTVKNKIIIKTKSDEKELLCDGENQSDIGMKVENNNENSPFQMQWIDSKENEGGVLSVLEELEAEKKDKRKDYQCSVCGQQFRHRHIFQRHMRVQHQVTGFARAKDCMCDICGKHFYDPYGLRMHKRSHSGDRPFTCYICGQGFTQHSNMERHISARHRKDKPFQCELCSKRFGYASTLREHTRAHNGDQNHQCSICSRMFSRRYALLRHQLTHTHARPYACRHCGRTYTQTNDLKAHVKRTHADASTDKLEDYCVKQLKE